MSISTRTPPTAPLRRIVKPIEVGGRAHLEIATLPHPNLDSTARATRSQGSDSTITAQYATMINRCSTSFDCRQEHMSEGASSTTAGVRPRWVVTLVHGTWGRGLFPKDDHKGAPRWFEAGSRFMNNLEVSFKGLSADADCQVEVFRWSGNNSIKERDAAARQLARTLEEQHARDSDCRQLVVAHSHGGNVTLRAIRHLKSPSRNLRIASMACPFVEVFPPGVETQPMDKWLFLSFSSSGLLYFCRFIAPRYLGTALADALTWALLILTIIVVYVEWASWRRRRTAARKDTFPDRMARLTSHGAFERSRIPLLVLRGVDDEASLVLAAGSLSAFLSRFIANVVTVLQRKLWQVMALIFLTVIGINILFLSLGVGLPDLGDFWSEMVIFGPLAIAWTGLALSALSHGVFGRELTGRFLGAELSSNSVPDTLGHVTVRTLPQGQLGGYRHGLYDHVDCASSILRWAAFTFSDIPLGWENPVDSRRSPSQRLSATLSKRAPED